MKPEVVIDQLVYQKIMHWVNKSNYEVSGLGKVVLEGGRYRVVDVMLLPQKNGSTHTDIEGDVVGKAMYELRETPGHLNFWWHSHVNMSVFWSGTDMDTIRKIGEGGWFLSTVFNKKQEMKSSLYVNNAFVNPELFKDKAVFIDDLPTNILNAISPELLAMWDRDYETNVENVTRVFTGGSIGTTVGNGKDSTGRAWKKKKKKWDGQRELIDTRTDYICHDCGRWSCICDEDDLGPLTYQEITTAFDEGKITKDEYESLLDRWAEQSANANALTASDDAPHLVGDEEEVNRHPAAKKAGPGGNGYPGGVF